MTHYNAIRQDSFNYIVGAMPLGEWPWYQDISYYPEGVWGLDHKDYRKWSVTFMEYDDYGSVEQHTFGHAEIMLAMRRMISSDRPQYVSDAAVRECKSFLNASTRDDTDFDSVTADEVIQIATFGEVRYS